MDRHDLQLAEELSAAIEAVHYNRKFRYAKDAKLAGNVVVRDYEQLSEALEVAAKNGDKAEVRRICEEILEMFDTYEADLAQAKKNPTFAKTAKVENIFSAVMSVAKALVGISVLKGVAKDTRYRYLSSGEKFSYGSMAFVGSAAVGANAANIITTIKAARNKTTVDLERVSNVIAMARKSVKEIMDDCR